MRSWWRHSCIYLHHLFFVILLHSTTASFSTLLRCGFSAPITLQTALALSSLKSTFGGMEPQSIFQDRLSKPSILIRCQESRLLISPSLSTLYLILSSSLYKDNTYYVVFLHFSLDRTKNLGQIWGSAGSPCQGPNVRQGLYYLLCSLGTNDMLRYFFYMCMI